MTGQANAGQPVKAVRNRIWSHQEIATLRHDLRGPLNQLIGYGELMTEIAEEESQPELIHHLKAVHRAVQGIMEIVNVWLGDQGKEFHPGYLLIFRDRLLQACTRLNRLVREARQHIAAAGLEGFREDGEKLTRAARQLEWMGQNLFDLSTAPAAVPELPKPLELAKPEPVSPEIASPSAAVSTGDKSDKPMLLVVDDQQANREILHRYLAREGYQVQQAESGEAALLKMSEQPFDLVLLDICMPGIDGVTVLREIKANATISATPVIMISGTDEIETVVKSIESGAEDYILKPFNPILLRTRIGVSLERRRMRDEEKRNTEELKAAMLEVQRQRTVAEDLLRNILPEKVATELRQRGEVDPMYFADVSILFTDFVGFGRSTEKLAAEELVSVLNDYFTDFDLIVDRYSLEKLKTVGDSYMCASGLPVPRASHPVDAVLAALEMVEAVKRRARSGLVDWAVRVGIHTGPVIAGVVGIRKFAFDIWGDSVNFASRMESHSEPNRINLSDKTYARVKDFFSCDKCENVQTKDGKKVETYLVKGLVPALQGNGESPPPAFRRRYRIYFQNEPPAFPQSLVGTGVPGETT